MEAWEPTHIAWPMLYVTALAMGTQPFPDFLCLTHNQIGRPWRNEVRWTSSNS